MHHHHHHHTNSAAVKSETVTKFEAAVSVIQSLPKDGPFKPSNEMMLRFYALFKRAKFGKCPGSKPGFWDPIARAKWEAWKSLDCMSVEDAMLQYVAELNKVVEAMPLTTEVSNFMETLVPLKVLRNGSSDNDEDAYSSTSELFVDASDLILPDTRMPVLPPHKQAEENRFEETVRQQLQSMEQHLHTLTEQCQRLNHFVTRVQRRQHSLNIAVILGAFSWPILLHFLLYLWKRRRSRKL